MKKIILFIATVLLICCVSICVLADPPQDVIITSSFTPEFSGISNLQSYFSYYNGSSFDTRLVPYFNWSTFGNPKRWEFKMEQGYWYLPVNAVFFGDYYVYNQGVTGNAFQLSVSNSLNIDMTYKILINFTRTNGLNYPVFINDNVISATPTLTLHNLIGSDLVLFSADNYIDNYTISTTNSQITVVGRFSGTIYAGNYSLKGWTIKCPFYIDFNRSKYNLSEISIHPNVIITSFDFPIGPDVDWHADIVPSLPSIQQPPTFDNYIDRWHEIGQIGNVLDSLFLDNNINMENSLIALTRFYNAFCNIPWLNYLLYVSLACGLTSFVFTGISLFFSERDKRTRDAERQTDREIKNNYYLERTEYYKSKRK